jgi:hypothetical protein
MATPKQQHSVIVHAVFVVHVFLFWAANAGQWCVDGATTSGVLGRCALTGLTAALLGGLVFLLKRCLDDDAKARLVFWRFRGPPYPAAAAFTEWIHNDPRVDAHVIAAKYDPLPVDPEAQNALWDRLFWMNERASGVEDAHWCYVLARDLVANWLSFGLCALIFVFWGPSHIVTKALFAVASIVIAVFLIRTARHFGILLVKNVLVAECRGS